jgi:hypothetical protein
MENRDNSTQYLQNLAELQKNPESKEKKEVFKICVDATVDTLRRIRTKIFSDESPLIQQELLQACEQINQTLVKEIVSYLLDKTTKEVLTKSVLGKLRKVEELYHLDRTPLTSRPDSQNNRSIDTHLKCVLDAIEKPDIYLGLGWKVITKNSNGIRIDYAQLSVDDCLVVGPLSTGLMAIQIWSELLTQLGKIPQPFKVETVAFSADLDRTVQHLPHEGIKKVFIIDDQVTPAKHTSKKAQEVYKESYSGKGTTVFSGATPEGVTV